MNKLKTIGIPCLITCAVGVIVACYVFPAVLALALAITLPLSDLFTDGMTLFWAMSFLGMFILVILYVITLLLLLKCFRGKERLVALSFAFSASVCLLFMHRHVFHGPVLSELIIEVFLILTASLIILWKKTKQPIPSTTKDSNCTPAGNH